MVAVSLRNVSLPPIPETVRQAVKARKRPHPMVAFLDAVGELFESSDFTHMYSVLGQSAMHPGLLALATLLQHAEGLSDRQAIEKMDDSLVWKYALRRDVGQSGWEPSRYSEFRERLLTSGSADLILEKIVHLAEEMGWLDPSQQRTDATHILSAAKLMNRIELIHECVYDCINELLDEAASFLLRILKKEWHDRYFLERAYNYKVPNTDKARQELAETIGGDAKHILDCIDRSDKASELNELLSVKILRRVVSEQFDDKDDGGLSYKDSSKLARAGERISSPDDPEATCGSKRGQTWLGFKAHFTEAYAVDKPHLITNVLTTQAHVNDSLVLEEIHRSLCSKGLKPKTHAVDAGYVNVAVLRKCNDVLDIDVLTRLTNGHSWQSKAENGIELKDFKIDFENKKATCPAGVESNSWKTRGGSDGVINIGFPGKKCGICPLKQDCTQSSSRKLQVKSQPLFEFMEQQRERQKTDEFKKAYRQRSGSEGTVSQLVHTGIRRSPYLGLAKTHLRNVLAAAGVNAIRIGNWLLGKGRAQTRKTRFEMLMALKAA